MIGRWSAALLVVVLLSGSIAAQEPRRIEGEEAEKMARLLAEASGKLRDLPLKITLDVTKSVGLGSKGHGGLLTPAEGLKADALKNLDKEIVPLGMMYSLGLTPVAAGQPLPASELRTVEVTVKDQTVTVSVLQLAAAKVAGRLVLLVYAGGKEPALVTTLVESTEAKELPLDLDGQKAGDQQATVVLSVLGRYRAAFTVAALE